MALLGAQPNAAHLYFRCILEGISILSNLDESGFLGDLGHDALRSLQTMNIENGLQERKDLAFTLKDTKTIVGKLETILGFAIHVLFIILYLLVFAVDVSKAWISFSSIIVAFSFIFSRAISDLFLSVVFLFVVHPFDVGDGIMIGTDMHFVSPSQRLRCPGSHRRSHKALLSCRIHCAHGEVWT